MFLFSQKTPQDKQQPAVSGIQFQTSVYGKCLAIVYGTNRIAPNVGWYGDLVAKKVKSSGGGGKGGTIGGSGGKGGASSATYTYKTSFLQFICEGPIESIGTVYMSKNVTSTSQQGMSVFTGTYPQTPWTYLTTNHPTEALGYNGIAYTAVNNFPLGNSTTMPNFNYEVFGFFSDSVNGYDADPSLVVTDFLSNATHGVGFPGARIGDLTNYQNYTLAAGLLISPAYSTQQAAAQTLEDIAKGTNSAWVWSSGELNLVPYGDAALSGNGKTYFPPASPIYDLTDDDFIAPEGSAPVTLARKRQSDSINSIKVEYYNRANNYNIGVIDVKDQAAIDLYGLREDSSNNAHLFCDATAAQTSAQLMLQRQSIRNAYEFTVTQKYILLDPMDIVTITDAALGLDRQWVRILTIEENDDYTLVITAEDYLAGTGSAPLYDFQTGAGYAVNYNSDPGSSNTPVVFEPPVEISTTGGLETWIATSGGENWGGCDVYISTDDATYQFIGRIIASARQGVLTTILPVGADPDTVNTLTVNLTESQGELLSGTQDDADKGHTLCYVGGELIAYETANLTSEFNYSLTYLRRGMYNSLIEEHAIGAQFARLDQQVLSYPYDPPQIGQLIYIKLAGFNIYGGGQQGLDEVSPYTHTIVGPPRPPDVENFLAKQVGDTVAFSWDPVSYFALSGYDIGYAFPGSTDWDDFTLLSEEGAGTEMTNASVPFGTWTFGIRSKDIAGQLSYNIATFDLTVVNTGNLLFLQNNAPDWLGQSSGFVRHWTGVIVPDNQFSPSHYSSYQDIDSFVVDPVSSGFYTGETVDIGYNNNVRVFGTISQANGPLTTGAPDTETLLDYWESGSTDPEVYVPWNNEFAELRYGKMRMAVTSITSTNANYYTQFAVEFDRAEATPQGGTALVSSADTLIEYPAAYHAAPAVTVTVQSTSPYLAIASPIFSSGFYCTVFSSDFTVSSLPQTVSWNAIGT